MSKLFKRAKVKLESALHSYRHMGDDDVFVDECCYNLQQSIELALKYLVEINGEAYIENHDIRANINKLEQMDIHVPMKAELRRIAATLYSWETQARYNDDFVALVDDIDDAMECAKGLIEYADTFVTQEKIDE